MNEQGKSEIEPNCAIEGTLHLEISASLDMGSTELIEEYTGRLIFNRHGGERYLVGKCKYWVARLNEMLEQDIDPSLELDDYNETAIGCELLGEERSWSDAVCKTCPNAVFGDMAILDLLIVNPPFRGKNVGLHWFTMLTRIFGGVGLFVLKPWPLQYSAKYAAWPEVARTKGAKRADTRKLMAYYEKAGFKRVPGTQTMVLDPTVFNPVNLCEDDDGGVTFQVAPEEAEKYRLAFAEKSAVEDL